MNNKTNQLPPTAPLNLLRRLEWRLRHAVESPLSGEYRSTFRGRGMEFDQVVKYEFGDDIRDIDWNVTARLGEPYRKKFVEEREVTLFLIFEDTPSLQFGSAARTKRETLLELAGLLMLLGALNRDRVGHIHVTPSGYQLREPARGRLPIHHNAAQLLGTPPPPLQNPNSQIENSTIPWPLITRAIPRHSILIWLNDHAPRPAPANWAYIQKRYHTLGIRVDDPWEIKLPTEKQIAVYDPLAQRLVTLNDTHAQRAAHAAWKHQRETHWQQLFPAPRDRLALSTEDNTLDTLVRFFQTRK